MAITTFADRYQSILVPLIFEPWAQELIRRAAPEPGEHILYLACGTGVVTRQVANHVAHPGCLVGVDHSGDMLAVARVLAENAGLDSEWVEADAANLPFGDGQFDLAFCQQALQFFPTWRPVQPFSNVSFKTLTGIRRSSVRRSSDAGEFLLRCSGMIIGPGPRRLYRFVQRYRAS